MSGLWIDMNEFANFQRGEVNAPQTAADKPTHKNFCVVFNN